jgi:hypothetical protein
MKNLTPAGSVQQAMKPALQVNNSPFEQGIFSANLNQGVNQSGDRSRVFLTGNQSRRIIHWSSVKE